jgi:hypothetical protein
MKTIGLTRVARVGFILLLLIQPLCSTDMAQSASGNSSRKVIRKNGWRVPGAEEMGTLVRIEQAEMGGIKVNKRILRSYSETEPLAIVDFFSTDAEGNVSISSGLFTVRTLIEYEANGNIFAYQVALIPTDANRNGTRTNLGVAYTFFYVDEDGDGNFETRNDSGKLPGVPDWAKTGNAKSSKSGSG